MATPAEDIRAFDHIRTMIDDSLTDLTETMSVLARRQVRTNNTLYAAEFSIPALITRLKGTIMQMGRNLSTADETTLERQVELFLTARKAFTAAVKQMSAQPSMAGPSLDAVILNQRKMASALSAIRTVLLRYR